MKSFLLFLALGTLAAQAQFASFQDPAMSPKPAAAEATFNPTNDIAGGYWLWIYKDVTNNGPVALLGNRVVGVTKNLVQPETAKQPTNSTDGIAFFTTGVILTNATEALVPPFTLWIRFKITSATGYKTLCSITSGNDAWAVNGQKLVHYFSSADHNIADLQLNVVYDFVDANGTCYTNGVAAASYTPNAGNFLLQSVGNDASAELLKGDMQIIGIWTNTSWTAGNAVSSSGYAP